VKNKKKPTLDLEALINGTLPMEDYGHDDFVPAYRIKPASPRWYWRHRLVQDDLNILAGTQGIGKSQVSCAIAAEATLRGEVVLVISAEDSPETTIVPRLLAAGAELYSQEKGPLVHIWRQTSSWDLEDYKKLQDYVYKLEADLVIIDPVAAYVTAKTDTYKDSHVRQLLSPLRAIGSDQGCTILAVMHLKKGSEQEAINTVGGSIAWTAAPRSVLMVKRLEDDPSGRVLYHAKCNVGAEQPALLFQIEQLEPGELGDWTSSYVRWGAEDSSLDVASAFAPPQLSDKRSTPATPALDKAVQWLKDVLKDGKDHLAHELITASEEAGIKRATLDKAKKVLGTRAENRGGAYYIVWDAATRSGE
jgi:hypothetical protein